MRVKNLIGVLLLLASPVALGATVGPAVGQPAPNFMGRTLDDSSYRLRGDTSKPKVINFFSLTCKPCRQEMPELGKLEKQYPGVKFISVNTKDDSPEAVQKFVKSLPDHPSNVLLTAGGLQESFNLMGLPHTVVLDRNNVVLVNLVGYTPENIKLLQKALQKLTKG